MIHLGELASPELVRRVKGVIFDCDGVMVDSLEANTVFYNWFKQQCGLPPMDEEETAYVHAHSVKASLARIIPEELHPRVDELRAQVDYRDLLPYIRMEPGLVSLLALLRSQGVSLAVNTNRTTTMELLLDHLGLHGFFFPVVTAGKVSMAKPHPEGVHYILRTWGVAPSEAAYVGDSGVDERTAQTSGVRFWAYKNPKLSAEMLVNDFGDLRRLFLRAVREGGLNPDPDSGKSA
jgi:HAD superfamily hydrolase (TIGR01509 family)